MPARAARTPRRVRVRVPASSANLGPGFDVLGLALRLYNVADFEERGDGLDLAVRGEGAALLGPQGADNLTIRAAEATFAEIGRRPRGLKVVLRNAIPIARGLGSSGAAILAGILGAAGLADARLSDDRVLALAMRFEGHVDNFTASYHGGCTAAIAEDGRVRSVRVPFPRGLRAVVLVPEMEISTAEARRILPGEVPFRDAVFNATRAGLLVAAMAAGDLSVMRDALHDRLHQPYRSKLIRGLEEVLEEGRRAGAVGCCLSGAGSSLIAFATDRADAVGRRMQRLWRDAFGIRSDVRVLGIDRSGARVTVSGRRWR
jgi:homoserine kinase